MRSKLKAKTEDGEEIGEEDADGDQFMAVDHDDDVGYVVTLCVFFLTYLPFRCDLHKIIGLTHHHIS